MNLQPQTAHTSDVVAIGPAAAATFDRSDTLDAIERLCAFEDYRRGDHIFRQGDPCHDVRYIRRGRVRLSVGFGSGRDGAVGILGPGAFLGDEAIAGRSAALATATAMTDSEICVLSKEQMLRLLRTDSAVSERFLAHLLSRCLRLEADLADQLVNPSEQRLARRLCLLAREWNLDQAHQRVPSDISQSVLAEMVGTTRSRVNVLLKRFKKQGFIEFDAGIRIKSSLQRVLQRG
jgi:CRP-like cAMP-binding protein